MGIPLRDLRAGFLSYHVEHNVPTAIRGEDGIDAMRPDAAHAVGGVALGAKELHALRRGDRINAGLRYHYDLTLEAYRQVEKMQRGVCLICDQPSITPRSKRLVVDHCHGKGVVRALLCHRCNCGIGYFKDDPALLEQARRYLLAFELADFGDAWPLRVQKMMEAMGKWEK